MGKGRLVVPLAHPPRADPWSPEIDVRASHGEFPASAWLSTQFRGSHLPRIGLLRIFQLKKVNHMWNRIAWIDG